MSISTLLSKEVYHLVDGLFHNSRMNDIPVIRKHPTFWTSLQIIHFLGHASKKAIAFSPNNLQDANLIRKANEQDLMLLNNRKKLYGGDWKLRMDKNNKTNVWTAVNYSVHPVKPYITSSAKDLL
ncbi:hypothetical protein A2U01_0035441, partial [Trifolium medium]|nr:hypothetical protein [Trifolium medium]